MLIDGRSIWAWFIRLFPRQTGTRADRAGRAGWLTLQSFVKVQIVVALIDGVGIGIGAALLEVPLAIPVGVLVFLGSLVPVIGAIATGAIAVFTALVYNGWIVAAAMLAIVLLVQQIESHILQPLIIGSAVNVHPLAVIFAVAAGSLLVGIPGAFFAVPVIAMLNSMVIAVARTLREGPWLTSPTILADTPSQRCVRGILCTPSAKVRARTRAARWLNRTVLLSLAICTQNKRGEATFVAVTSRHRRNR
ncbi:AI-2E family transporter [Arthrobacter sp. SA17]